MQASKFIKRIMAWVLTFALMAGVTPLTMPLTAQAAGTTGNPIQINIGTVSADGSGYTYSDNTVTITEAGYYEFTGSTTAKRIAVQSDLTGVNITLNGVSIDVSGSANTCAFDMSGATVNLTLLGGNTLKSGENRAGLEVPSNAILTITADSTESLTATGGNYGAGIGGGDDAAGGNITINGGTVTATGGIYATGIGGGWNGSGGTVTINSGTVTANGGTDINNGRGGAGIGGGYAKEGGNITINGGIVTVNGGSGAAGIGGGYAGDCGTVTINGGKVIANGREGGAGIGGGFNNAGGYVTINGGTVFANGGESAAGIGSGRGGIVKGTLIINGGSVQRNGAAAKEFAAKNGAEQSVCFTTLTVGETPAVESSITAGIINNMPCAVTPDTQSGVYGINGVKTDDAGKLYFWLPEGINIPVRVTANDTDYTGVISPNTDNNAMTTLILTQENAVSVGTQNGTLVEGEAGNVTFTVTTANIANNIYTVTLSGAPTGVTAEDITISSNSGTLMLTTTTSTPGGTYPLTITIDGTTSNSFNLVVNTILDDLTIGITAPVTGAAPQSAIVRTGYTGTITWYNVTDGASHTGAFAALKVYKATVTLTSTAGYQWPSIAPAITVDGQTVSNVNVSGTGTGNTLTFDVEFTVTSPLSSVVNSSGSAAVTYAGTTIDLSAVSGLFTIDEYAGAKTYSVESSGGPTGVGAIGTDGKTLTVTKAGTFIIGLVTAETLTHAAGEKVTATLTVNKGDQNAPANLGKSHVTTEGGSDGKITGLTANTAYEYKKDSGGYTKVTTNSSGEITGLTAGSYVVRFAENDLYNESADSDEIVIGEPPSTTNITFTAVQVGGVSEKTDSTGITLTFSSAVLGLTANDVAIQNGTGAAVKGTLSGSGTEWTIVLDSVTAEGDVTVSIADFGMFHVTNNPQTVAVYKNENWQEVGDFLVKASKNFTFSGGILQINQSGDYTVKMKVPGSTTGNSINILGSGIEVNLTLDGVKINCFRSALWLNTGTTLYLTLVGENELTSNTECSGLQVGATRTIVITADSMGSLTANGGERAAGIGGSAGLPDPNDKFGGSLTINGGTVIANGNNGGAGIGGAEGGIGNDVTINGGTVIATGGSSEFGSGAGIGGGYGKSGGYVIINGGSVWRSGIDKLESATAINSAVEPVYLTTLTVGDPAELNAPITAGEINDMPCAVTPDAQRGVYGINGVKTDDAGKLYFWLPVGTGVPVSVTESGIEYTGVVSPNASNDASATLSAPAIDGTLNAIAVDAATGKLTATVNGGTGTYIYTWSVAGQGSTLNGTVNGSEYTPAATELGKAITCTVTKAGRGGSLSESETVYKTVVTLSGEASGDSASITNAYGKEGDSISIAYTVGNTGSVAFTVTSGTITHSESPAAYTIASADAASGIITITAIFTHTSADSPTVISAETSVDGTKVLLTFNKAMSNTGLVASNFTVMCGDNENVVTNIALNSGDAKIIELTLTTPVTNGQSVTVAYTKGTAVAADAGVLESFTGKNVDNKVPAAATGAYTVEVTTVTNTDAVGTAIPITLTVKKSDGTIDTAFTGAYTVAVNGQVQAPNGSYGTFNGTALTASSTVVSVDFTAGIATVDLILHKAGTAQNMTFSVANVATPLASGSVIVTPVYDPNEANAVLTITQQPAAPSTNGGVLGTQPTLTITDKYENPFTTGSITASAKNTAWTIGGTTTANISSGGTVTFTGLTAEHSAELPDAVITFTLNASAKTIDSAGFNIPALAAVPLSTPDNVSVTAAGEVSWNTVTNALSYTIKVYKGSDTTALLTLTDKTGTSYLLTNTDIAGNITAAGSDYCVTVTAIGNGTSYSNSAESAKVSGAVIYSAALTTSGLSTISGDNVSFNGSPVITDTTTTVYVLSGSTVGFSAIAGWSRSVVISGDAAASRDITNITANKAITATFSADATDAPVTAAAITGVTSPVGGAAPSTTINNGTGFTASLIWNGSPSTFAYNTAYTATITLTAASSYTFSGGFGNTTAIAEFTVNGIAPTTWVSNNGSTLVFTVTFPATGNAPTAPLSGEIVIGMNHWNAFWNTITFGLLCKETKTATVTTSGGDGAVTIQYYLSATEFTDEAALISGATWSNYASGISLNPNSKNIIYVKLTDLSETVYLNSAGVVIYTDSEQDTANISFTKGDTSVVTADVKLNNNTINKIMNDSYTLTSGTDYTVLNGTITFKATYLDTLAAGNYTLTIHYNPMGVEYPNPQLDGSVAPATTTIALTVSDVPTYMVTVNGGAGATGGGSYASGATVNISAGTAPSGKQFKNWTASPAVTFGDANSASTSFTMPANAVTVTAVWADIPATVTDVTVSPATIEVQKGTMQQFIATVSGTNNPSQVVTWSIVEPVTAGTSITLDGALTVAADEAMSTLTIKATSAADNNKYGTATVTVTSGTPAPVCGIAIDRSGIYTFPDATDGYGAQSGLSVKVSNAGNQATGSLTIGVSDTTAFELSTASIANIVVGGDSTFTVTPKTGLAAGTYTATVTVSGGNGIVSQTFDVSFKVTPAALTGTATITGNTPPRIGDTLTGSLDGGNNTGTLIYTWKAGGSQVQSGAVTSYTVLAADLGKTITLEITSTVQTGTVISAVTATVAKKTAPIAPNAPTLDSKTHNTVTLTANAVYEFSKDGFNWQISNVFTGLSPNTAYTFYQRIAATADTEASGASAGFSTTTDSAPAGALTGTATIKGNTPPRISDTLTGSLVSGNNTGTLTYTWKAGGSQVQSDTGESYTIQTADLGKTITLEITSSIQTGTRTSAATSAVAKKTAPTAPNAPILVSKTHNTVTLTANSAYEFSKDGTNWQTSNVFTGLSPNMVYTFYQRIATTSDTEASGASTGFSVTTDAAQSYTLTVSAGMGGTAYLSSGTTSGSYAAGTVINITASSNSNYSFNGWSTSNGGTFGNANSASTTFAMPPNAVTITAHFVYNGSSGGNESGNTGGNENGNTEGSTGSSNTTTEPAKTVNIDVNGQTVKATLNTDGSLTLTYTDADIQKYSDSSGKFDITVNGQDSVTFNIPIPTLDGDDLAIHTDFGTITIPNETLQALRTLYGNTLRLTVTKGSFKVALLDRNNKEIAYRNSAHPFIVTIPYKLAVGQKSGAVVAVDSKGVILPFSVYANGSVKFEITSTGTYDVRYNPKTFADITGHWAADFIGFVAAREIFNGTGNGQFSPNGFMTRAMFAMALSNLDGVNLSVYRTSRFNDVTVGEWYAATVEWAADKKIVNGIGDGQFAPNAEITREQMVTMLWNYAKYAGIDISVGENTNILLYNDVFEISEYAISAMQWACGAGIISGKPGGLLDPKGTATRAEVATIFARFVESVAGVTASGNRKTANIPMSANSFLVMLPGKENEFAAVDENDGKTKM